MLFLLPWAHVNETSCTTHKNYHTLERYTNRVLLVWSLTQPRHTHREKRRVTVVRAVASHLIKKLVQIGKRSERDRQRFLRCFEGFQREALPAVAGVGAKDRVAELEGTQNLIFLFLLSISCPARPTHHHRARQLKNTRTNESVQTQHTQQQCFGSFAYTREHGVWWSVSLCVYLCAPVKMGSVHAENGTTRCWCCFVYVFTAGARRRVRRARMLTGRNVMRCWTEGLEYLESSGGDLLPSSPANRVDVTLCMSLCERETKRDCVCLLQWRLNSVLSTHTTHTAREAHATHNTEPI